MTLSRWWRRLSSRNPHRRCAHSTVLGRRNRFVPAIETLEDRCLLSADMVLRWNEVALDAGVQDNALTAAHEQAGPTRAARALAIVHAAIYDAVNSIDRSNTPYLVDDTQAPAGASIEAAIAQAGHDTLAALYPHQQATFDADLAADLAGIPSGSGQAGAQVGAFVAAQVLAIRANDGSNATMSYTPGSQPGDWQPDPLHPTQQALTPQWGDVTPFAMTSASQFQVPPPPPLDSQAYTDAYNEVMEFGGDGVTTPTLRTPEETQIGIFWAYDGQPGVGTPPRLYNQIAQVIARQEGNTEIQNARFFALINLAMGDAGIAAWNTKYTYNFWRPITAIRDAATTGNPNLVADPNWTPLGAQADNGNGTNFTPPFPAYDSGHATFGGALFRIMADFYGTDNISFTIGSDEFNGITRDASGQTRGIVFRSFTSFSQAADENAQSRINLGIHWAFDKTEGIAQGTQIADYLFGNFLRPRVQQRDLVVGADAGSMPEVKVYDAVTGAVKLDFLAFSPTFTGGVRVAMGDVTGDGRPDIIVGAGHGGAPEVKVFSGVDGSLLRDFLAFSPMFTGGVNVAAGDVNGDGYLDVIVSADAGGAPEVKVFSGQGNGVLDDFLAYDASFSGGVTVAAGDVNGDGYADVITGMASGPALVKAFSGRDGSQLLSFLAYASSFTGGVYVAAGDVNGDGQADIITGAGGGGAPHVEVFLNNQATLMAGVMAFDSRFIGGARVAAMDLNGEGRADLVVGAGPPGSPEVRILDGVSLNELDSFFAFDPHLQTGVCVGSGQ